MHPTAAISSPPETRYARSGEVVIAYQVAGDGPLDLVVVPSWITNVEENWEEPSYARFLGRLASFTRLILFDKRGTGLSDRVATMPTLEDRMTAVGSEQAALFGSTEGGAMCALFAATYPERTSALIMYGSYAKRIRSANYPWGPTPEERQVFYDALTREWGGPAVLDYLAPNMVGDERFCHWWAGYLRRSASPGAALALTQMNSEIDIRRVLDAIRVPTLILHRKDDPLCPIEGGRYLAERIPNARLVELPGRDHLPFVGDVDAIVDAVQEFLTGVPPVVDAERILTTLMFVDVVGSTQHASALGDRAWRDLLTAYRDVVRRELARFQGRERGITGDNVLATFDGPARAIRCGLAVVAAVQQLGIGVRIGLHAGECDVRSDEVAGVAVHIGARVADLARAGEILVSSTVKELVVGSGLAFADRGRHTLRGVPGLWQVFAVEPVPGSR